MWQWDTGRSARLPSNWRELRRFVLRRDGGMCQLGFDGCLVTATEVDHIRRGDNHSVDNLQAVCGSCHRRKTVAEALGAKRRKRAARFRPVARHPGLK